MERVIIVKIKTVFFFDSVEKGKPTRRLRIQEAAAWVSRGPKVNLRGISEGLQKVDLPAQQPGCRNKGDR
jgi:hypothetical protein